MRLIRTFTIILAVALAFPLAPLAAAPIMERQTAGPATVPGFGAEALRELNGARRSHGLAAVRFSSALAKAATRHARSMAEDGYFSHSSQGGGTPSSRIARFYRGSLVGETLLWRSPTLSPQQAIQLWLDSPSHRSVLLHRGFREVAIVALRVPNAPGVYGGRDVTIVVADYGAR
jgi:uncharacterized protein YkwD